MLADLAARSTTTRVLSTAAAVILSEVIYFGGIILLAAHGFWWILGIPVLAIWPAFVILVGPMVRYSRFWAVAFLIPFVGFYAVPFITGRIVWRLLYPPAPTVPR